VEELQGKVDKLEEEKVALEKAKESWKAERKRLATWRVRCLDSVEKLNKRIGELEEDYDDLKDKYDGVVGELDDLKNSIIQEHINGFEKGLRQVAFFHQDVDVTDSRFDVNKDFTVTESWSRRMRTVGMRRRWRRWQRRRRRRAIPRLHPSPQTRIWS